MANAQPVPARAGDKRPRPKQSAAGASRAKACGSKQAFDTIEAAKSAMMGFKKRQGIQTFFAVYQCRFCRKFHFGNGMKSGMPVYERRVNAIDRALARDAKIRERCEARRTE